MITLDQIKDALVSSFQGVVTKERLSGEAQFDIVKKAKRLGILLSRAAGHNNSEIAQAFGYSSAKSLSATFFRSVGECREDDWMKGKARDIAATFGDDFLQKIDETLSL
ncbi:MAG: hypothetical protein KDI13_06955 [Alphaproteobacteria bacterium]|nr:hypothetical protein [Alphaproteobacteria bacterium]